MNTPQSNKITLPLPRLLPGDVVLARNNSLIGRLIRWATRRGGEGATWANHVGAVSRPPLVVEALHRVVEHEVNQVRGRLQIWRLERLTPEQRLIIGRGLARYIGRGYGYHKLLLQLLDAALAKLIGREVVLFRRLQFIDQVPICSWVVGRAYDDLDYRFGGLPPEAVTPDDIHDHLTTSPDWRLIWERS